VIKTRTKGYDMNTYKTKTNRCDMWMRMGEGRGRVGWDRKGGREGIG